MTIENSTTIENGSAVEGSMTYATHQLTGYIEDLFYDFESAALDVDSLPVELIDLGESLMFLGNAIKEARRLGSDLTKGKLDSAPISVSNAFARESKTLQSILKRLAWQLEQIASGNDKQNLIAFGSITRYISDIMSQFKTTKTQLAAALDATDAIKESLLQSNSLFESIMSNSPQLIVVMELSTGEWLYFNNSPITALNCTSPEEELIQWMRTSAHEAMELIEKDKLSSYSFKLDPADVDIDCHFTVSLYPINWHNHNSMAFIFTDDTESTHKIDELKNLAYYDELTGAYSRYKGMEIFNKLIEEKSPFIVSFVDLDDLKYINDVFGHTAGDDYILTVAQLLSEFDANVVVTRLGGDEFMLLSRGWKEEDAVQRLEDMRERLIENSKKAVRSALQQNSEHSKQNPNLNYYSISFGIVEVGMDNESSASYLLSRADEKMYQYKRARKQERLVPK
ncbi:MAG: GGDEF domain-containing protein [Coriobacteriales bacterium]|jgi:diguanylate cyclase (GGDEF)-like protein|nr:GGDEF domain-containing protein [Coriobacteriales bacterium]